MGLTCGRIPGISVICRCTMHPALLTGTSTVKARPAMAGRFATPLLIAYACLQLVMPVGGHDVLENFDDEVRRPHLHLSLIDQLFGLKAATDRGDAARLSSGLRWPSDVEHDGDVVYLPSESSISDTKLKGAAMECVEVARHVPNHLEIASGKTSLSPPTLRHHADLAAAIDLLAAIARWQI